MKTLSLWILTLANVLPLVSSIEFVISPWTFRDASTGLGYADFDATVGDSISFFFTDEVHNVFIHPTLNCENQTGRITVGNVSPVVFNFTEDFATPEGNPLFFACDVDLHCEQFGMSFTVTLFSAVAPTVPTDPPFVAPTDPPLAPVAAPVAPTEPPVEPTEPPVEPTEPPAEPTEPPVEPTEAPVVPTDAPVPPTDAPSDPPVDSPVASPVAPTDEPVEPTDTPTIEPTETDPPEPTPVPSGEVSTPKPAGGATTESLPGLRMTLFGISAFPVDAQATWQEETALFSSSYVFNELQGQVSSFDTTYTVTDYTLSTMQRSRQLQLPKSLRPSRGLQQEEDFVTVIFTQVMNYDVNGGSSVTAEQLATAPFASVAQRQSFVGLLQVSGDPTLSQVAAVSEVESAGSPTSPPVPPPTEPPTEEPSGLSTGIIIGIACGGGAFLLLILGVVYFMYCKSSPSLDSKNNDPPMSVIVKDDEVSTLAGPQTVVGGANGDQSVATVDYDYSKAYGVGDTSVSSAGGTFGSNTQNQSAFDLMNGAATGAALGQFDDDASFEALYREPKSNAKQEILHIFAPSGKLGVVIDTPDDGAPVVHAVKESSVVFDKVQVGDKLVAVDDEDVRTMTAVKVSKLISRKSGNPSRKLTVLRTTLIE